MLHEFLSANREEIIARASAKVAKPTAPRATHSSLENGISLFVTQLVGMLATGELGPEAIGTAAARYGDELRRMGFTVGEVVHHYGGVCQAITDLAVERHTSIGSDEFKILNGCLDDAIAFAVTEFGRQREQSISDQGLEHLGVLAHELRNSLNSATLAFSALQSGAVGTSGSTSAVVFRSLAQMRTLLDRSFVEVRLKAGIHKRTHVSVASLIEDVAIAATVEAAHRGLQFTVAPPDDGAMIHADEQILASALSNLIQNAFKFTHPGGQVSLSTHNTAARVRIDIEDECGGLPPGENDHLSGCSSNGAPIEPGSASDSRSAARGSRTATA
jgi:signal transduction histidine kinase